MIWLVKVNSFLPLLWASDDKIAKSSAPNSSAQVQVCQRDLIVITTSVLLWCSATSATQHCYFFLWCILAPLFLLFLGTGNKIRTDLNSNRISKHLQPSQLFSFQNWEGNNFSPSGTSKIQSQNVLLILKALCTMRRTGVFVKMEVLRFDIFSGLAGLPHFLGTPCHREEFQW